MNLDNYLSAYLDRRMGAIISEWQISSRGELTDLSQRLGRAQEELAGLKRFEKEVSDRLLSLEERTRLLRERVR